MKFSRLFFASTAIFAMGAVHAAAPAPATLNVSATVEQSCSIDSVGAVSFGSYNPAATTAVLAAGSIRVSCVKGTAPIIALDNGLNSTSGPRKMKNADSADLLSYQLFQPTGNQYSCATNEQTVWGSADTTPLKPGASTGIAPVTYSVCGKIDAQQDVGAGTYNDTVTATVTF